MILTVINVILQDRVMVILVSLLLIMDKVLPHMVKMVHPLVMEQVITRATIPVKATVRATVMETVIMEIIITSLALPRPILTTQDLNPVTLADMDMVAVAVVVAVVVVVAVATGPDKDILNHPQMQYSCRPYNVDRNATSTHFRNSTPKSNGMSFNSRPRQSVARKVSDAFLTQHISPALIPNMKHFKLCVSFSKLYSSIRLTPPLVNLLSDVTARTVVMRKHAGKIFVPTIKLQVAPHSHVLR